MQFNKHTNLKGLHAPFAASNPSWLRYSDEQIVERYMNRNRKMLGSELHDYARSQILLCQKVSSIKSLVSDIATFIFAKYDALDKPELGMSIVKDIKRLPKEVFETVKLHINDAIGYRMEAEVVLFYSDKSFGTTDAISFKNNFLRIHDLKTGDTPVNNMDQLIIYAAYFCLEYKIKLGELAGCELRIYQNNEVKCYEPDIDEIAHAMDRTIHCNKLTFTLDEEV